MTDSAIAKRKPSCSVLLDVDIGSDHRPVTIKIDFKTQQHKPRKRKKTCKAWRPNEAYKDTLEESLANMTKEQTNIDGRVALIHNALVKAAEDSISAEQSDLPPSPCEIETKIRALINQRRQVARSDNTAEEKKKSRIHLGKQIQKLIREKLVKQKTEKMRTVLAEFKDLQ